MRLVVVFRSQCCCQHFPSIYPSVFALIVHAEAVWICNAVAIGIERQNLTDIAVHGCWLAAGVTFVSVRLAHESFPARLVPSISHKTLTMPLLVCDEQEGDAARPLTSVGQRYDPDWSLTTESVAWIRADVAARSRNHVSSCGLAA